MAKRHLPGSFVFADPIVMDCPWPAGQKTEPARHRKHLVKPHWLMQFIDYDQSIIKDGILQLR